MALCVTHGAAPAWAAPFTAVKQPCSTRAKGDMYPRPLACVFRGKRRARASGGQGYSQRHAATARAENVVFGLFTTAGIPELQMFRHASSRSRPFRSPAAPLLRSELFADEGYSSIPPSRRRRAARPPVPAAVRVEKAAPPLQAQVSAAQAAPASRASPNPAIADIRQAAAANRKIRAAPAARKPPTGTCDTSQDAGR